MRVFSFKEGVRNGESYHKKGLEVALLGGYLTVSNYERKHKGTFARGSISKAVKSGQITANESHSDDIRCRNCERVFSSVKNTGGKSALLPAPQPLLKLKHYERT